MRRTEVLNAQPTHHTTIFNEAVMAVPFPLNFKMPNIPLYNGKGNRITYVEVFRSWMDFERVYELARCRTFLSTLSRLV